MKPSDFYLCYLKVLSKSELNLIHDYWMFGDTLDDYKYKLNDFRFNMRNDVIPNISSNIGKYVYIASKFLSCNICGDKLKAASRSQLQKLFGKRPEKCTRCLEGEINKIATEKLARLVECASEFNFSVVENDINFNYLDALFIFIILHEGTEHFSGRIFDPKNLNITGSHEHDTQILTDLLSKKFIYEIDDSAFPKNSYFHEDINYLHRYGSYLSLENRYKFNNFISKMPQLGFYVAKPDSFEDRSILMHFLHEEILTKEISVKDVKLLEELVNKTLLHKAYQLIPIVENDHRITIERNLMLETILLHGVKHFLLNQVFSVFHYQGRLTAADIYSKPSIYRKVHEKIYIKNIENHLNKLEGIAEEKRYKKNLPANMIDSKVEIFSSRYFLGGVMSWANLSGKEVLKRWVSAHENAD